MSNQEKPYVICHMMSTIDGKITSGTGTDILEDYFKLYTQVENMLEAKAWMIGRVTMEMFAEGKDTPLPVLTKVVPETDFINSGENKTFMFAVDTKGSLRWKDNSITLSNVTEKLHLVVIVTHKTPKEYLSYLQSKGISYIFGGNQELDFDQTLKTIKEKFGVERLLLEGGGKLNGSLMAVDLIDEISLLLTPKVLNRSAAPAVFDSNRQEIDTKKYGLFDVKKMDQDAVWLRYKKLA